MSLLPNEGQKSLFPMIEELRKEVERLQKENAELQQQLKNCNLQNVSQQRELLYGFSTWHNAKPQKERYDMIYVGEIEDFLKP